LGKDGEVKVETEPAKCNKCKKLLCERHAWWAKKKTQHEEDFEGWEESNPIIVEKTDFDSVPFRKEYVTVSPGGHMYAKYRDTGIVHEYIEYLCLDHPPFFLAKFLWTSRRDKQS
jgi:hypothetical protein